jgi:hypothetical protein
LGPQQGIAVFDGVRCKVCSRFEATWGGDGMDEEMNGRDEWKRIRYLQSM